MALFLANPEDRAQPVILYTYNPTTLVYERFISVGISGIGDDRKIVTTAGTAVALAASTLAKIVVITAETDNTGIIVVGASTVVASLATRRGTPLNPGDTVALECDDLADVFIDSAVNGDGVTFTYLT